MFIGIACTFGLLLGWSLHAPPAVAGRRTDDGASTEGPLVVLLGAPEDAPLTARIAAELRALGFVLHIRTLAHEPDEAASTVADALAGGARAAIEIDARAGRTAVSVAAPETGHVAMKQVLEAPPTATLDTLLAVRTVEFVRATLLGPPSAPGEPGGDDALRLRPPARRPSESRFESTFSSGAVAAQGGLGTEAIVGLQLGLRVGAHLRAESFGFAPLSDKTVTAGAGTSRSVTWLAGGGLSARLPIRARGAIDLGAGALAVCLRATGTPTPMHVGQTATGWGAALYARLGGEVTISGPISLRADAIGGGALLRPVLTLGDSGDQASWGRAFVAGLLGLKLRWW